MAVLPNDYRISLPKVDAVDPERGIGDAARAVIQIENAINDLSKLTELYRLAAACDVAVGNYSMTDSKPLISYEGTGEHNIVLPKADARGKGVSMLIGIGHNGLGSLTLQPLLSSTETVNGVSSLVLYAGQHVWLFSNGNSKWSVFPNTAGRSFQSWKERNSTLTVRHFANKVTSAAPGTGAPTANVLRCIPFIAPEAGGLLNMVEINITVGVAGNVNLGIYTNKSDVNLLPYRLIGNSGSISTAVAGVKQWTLTPGFRYTPGQLYWLAIVSSAAPTMNTLAITEMSHLLGSQDMVNCNVGYTQAFAYAATMPDPCTATTGLAAPIPAIAYRMTI